MALWLVRAGSSGEREQDALQHNLAIVGWSRLRNLWDLGRPVAEKLLEQVRLLSNEVLTS